MRWIGYLHQFLFSCNKHPSRSLDWAISIKVPIWMWKEIILWLKGGPRHRRTSCITAKVWKAISNVFPFQAILSLSWGSEDIWLPKGFTPSRLCPVGMTILWLRWICSGWEGVSVWQPMQFYTSFWAACVKSTILQEIHTSPFTLGSSGIGHQCWDIHLTSGLEIRCNNVSMMLHHTNDIR